MNHNLSEADGLSITYLHGNKFFRRLGSLSTHLPRLDDTHDHLASPLDSFEGRRCRSVMIVFDSLDLLEDLCTDPAHLQWQILPFQGVRRKIYLFASEISEAVSTQILYAPIGIFFLFLFIILYFVLIIYRYEHSENEIIVYFKFDKFAGDWTVWIATEMD